MNLKTSDLMIASVRLFDPNKGILIGYGGEENQVIFPGPKVVLYRYRNQFINLFDPSDKVPIITQNYELVGIDMEPKLGICYEEDKTLSLFPRGKILCSLEEIENQMISSPYFFYNREEIVDRRIHALDEAYFANSIKKIEYERKLMNLLQLKYQDRNKKQRFEDVMKKFTYEGKQYRK